ncbi:MAG TPA: PBP1A family penicillin-binding protein [Allosphingosinicella sp.]|uniref:transglycosylase domain-containing protein n=1 Tax=Allosphingosinicella sp. TaxID=2823234 RepID=UPI002EDAA2E1
MLYRDTPVAEPFEPAPAIPPAAPVPEDPQAAAKLRRKIKRIAAILLALFLVLIAWLAITAPLSRSLQPIAAPGITLVAADGTPIARRGAVTDKPVAVEDLPDHVPQAFIAIEDRRFYNHAGVDPWGIMRAAVKNVVAGGVVEGGSTISQQLAKLAFLSSDRTYGRKAQEFIMAFWLEAWLSKDEILSRYMSGAYFGDNVYGLRAASRHYFSKDPENLTVEQAAMLAGLVKAPSRLAPTSNLKAARERGDVVEAAMVDAGFLTEAEAKKLPKAKLKVTRGDEIPTGTYFADWVFPQARDFAEGVYGEQTIKTTLDTRIQRNAVRAIQRAGLGKAQVALVAMRPNGEVVAMVGGKSYRQSPFNRATQARRQPGSTFKLFVYLAALRRGLTPDTSVVDAPVTVGDWSPKNSGGVYRGQITMRDAFAWSSNVATVRLSERVGRDNVIQAARDLGVTAELRNHPSLALGTSGVSLIEMAAAYAAIANGSYPVKGYGLPKQEDDGGWFASFMDDQSRLGRRIQPMMLDMLWQAANVGTGRAAALNVDTFGKTGTSQDNRDAIFIGFAGDLVTAVWIGNDDNSPLRGIQGGGLPARIWRDFMTASVKGAAPSRRVVAPPQQEPLPPAGPDIRVQPGRVTVPIEGTGYEVGVDFSRESIGISARPTQPDGGERPQPREPVFEPQALPPPENEPTEEE